MKNLKDYDKFNEELDVDTYQKIKNHGLDRGDPRGQRLYKTADALMDQNSPALDLFDKRGEKLATVIPLRVAKTDYGYGIGLKAFPWEITFKEKGYKTWTASTENDIVYFDRKGRNIIINLFNRKGIEVPDLANKIPMI